MTEVDRTMSGLECPKCGERKTPSAQQCQACRLEEMFGRRPELKRKVRDACVECGGPVTPRYARCLTCRKKAVEATAGQGRPRCGECGEPVTNRSTGLCRSCHARKLARDRTVINTCADCHRPITAASTRCRDCGQKHRRAAEQKVPPRLCVDCGVELKGHSSAVQRCRACRGKSEQKDRTIPRPCTRCGIVKPPEDFYVDGRGKHSAMCRTCLYHRKLERVSPEERLLTQRASRLRIPPSGLRALQFPRECEICGAEAEVDHLHGTELVRGPLCGRHNKALGNVQDHADELVALIGYLERHMRPCTACGAPAVYRDDLCSHCYVARDVGPLAVGLRTGSLARGRRLPRAAPVRGNLNMRSY